MRNTSFYKRLTPSSAVLMLETEELSEEKQLTVWQYLVDIGLVWQLQGFYGRGATALIEAGHILPANKEEQ